jgi:hypothetical protein
MRQTSGKPMPKILATTLLLLLLSGSHAALADDYCAPSCDKWHYYGPYDFSYIRPGLLGYPVCDRLGNCAPHLVYTHPDWRRITIIPRGPATRSRP